MAPVRSTGSRLGKDITKLMRCARRAGWVIDKTGKGHLRWRSPEGRLVITSLSPSTTGAIGAIKRDLIRAGLRP